MPTCHIIIHSQIETTHVLVTPVTKYSDCYSSLVLQLPFRLLKQKPGKLTISINIQASILLWGWGHGPHRLGARPPRSRLFTLSRYQHQIFVHVACGLGSVFLWPICYVHRVLQITSCFHTMGPMGRIKHDVMIRIVCQVVVPVWRQTTTVFGWVRQNVAPGPKSAIYLVITTIRSL